MLLKNWNRIVFVSALLIPGAYTVSQESASSAAPASSTSTQAPKPLSETALKTLVSGIAFYPDSVIEDVLAASQDLLSLHQAAQGDLPDSASAALQRLSKDLNVLKQLDRYPATTARLALAARTQLPDVWNAIDALRADLDSFLAKKSIADPGSLPADSGSSSVVNTINSAGGGTSGGVAAFPVPLPATLNAFRVGLIADDIIDEINEPSVVVIAADGNALIAQPEDGANYSAGAVANPTTGTYAAGKLSSSGSVTTNPDGSTSYSRSADSAGAVVNTNTGTYAAGKRSTSGSITTNPDGSTSFSRSATTQTQSTYGNSTVSRTSSGTVTGNGGGTFQGETNIESSHGDVSISTEAGGGQISTTVTTENGTKEYSAGNGEHKNQPDLASTSTNSLPSADTASQQKGGRVSKEQMAQAENMMTENWGRLESHPKNVSARSSFLRNNGTAPTTARSVPAAGGQRPAGAAAASGQRSPTGQRGTPSSRSTGRENNRSGGGRPGRRR